jgi:GNAT superfamily N-acetyltransferase
MADTLAIRRVSYQHPDAVALTEEAQRFYISLYGGPDGTPFTADEFAPPNGGFFVGYLHGRPVAMGGWRFNHDGVPSDARRPGELKRMFVRENLRGRGFAQRMLAALEADAAAAGADWLILQTGSPQADAVRFYLAAGYQPIASFGYYAHVPTVVNLGKPLGQPQSSR